MKKYILSLFMLAFIPTVMFAQTDKLNQLFDRYQEAEGVTSIKIAKPMFSMLNKLDIGDDELDQIKPLLSKINGLKILIVEKPTIEKKDSSEVKKLTLGYDNLQKEIGKAVSNLKYDELMTVNSKGNKIKFLASDTTKDILDNLLLSINAEGNTVLMMLDGKISMDDVSKLISESEKK